MEISLQLLTGKKTSKNCAELRKKNCQKIWFSSLDAASAHHLATWGFHYACIKWICHFVFFFSPTGCSLAEMPAGIFVIVFTCVSLHVLSAFRHHREGFNWHFDKQKRRSEAANLCSLSGSHRQSEIRVFLSRLSNYNINKSRCWRYPDAVCVFARLQLRFAYGCFWLKDSSVLLLLQTLLEDIKGDTRGSFEALLVALITPPALFDSQEVMRAMNVSVWVMLLFFKL